MLYRVKGASVHHIPLSIAMVLFFMMGNCLNAQPVSSGSYDYAEELDKEFQRFGKDSAVRSINLDSFDQLFFQNQDAFYGVDPNTRWMPLFEYGFYWEHVVGQDPMKSSQVSFPESPIYIKQIMHGSRMVYSAENLLEGLEIGIEYFIPRTPYLSAFPLVLDRNDPKNRQWVVIASEDYLVLRYVHSYPNGNQTSFYWEKRYCFKRAP